MSKLFPHSIKTNPAQHTRKIPEADRRCRKQLINLRVAALIITIVAAFTFDNQNLLAQGTWIPVATLAPDSNGGGMLLLSDGSVICKSFSSGFDWIGNNYDRLTPDIHGSYANGTWSHIANMIDSRLYFSSQVLMDGRVYVAGGEYGSGGNSAEVYDPLNDSWTAAPYTGFYIGDANTEILSDGRVLQALVGAGGSTGTIIYNPASNNWNFGPEALGSHNESAWVKLPDNSILFVNIHSTSSERYIPSLNQWIQDADVPVSLYDDYGYECGGALMLPDGRAFFLGSTGHTAYYTPSGSGNPGTWAAGPDMPNGQGTPDAATAMLVNGKVLLAVSEAPPPLFAYGTSYYEFNYVDSSYTQIDAPPGGQTVNEPCYFTGMVDLPDGSVLYADQYSKQYYVYKPDGDPLEAGKPTINKIIQLNCDTFMAVGTLFNGISEGASYGDDWQMATNYPIIRLTEDSNVYYARTFDWNRTAIMTDTLADTTLFTLPAGLPDTVFSLVVIANGIASDTVSFAPYPILTSSHNPPGICSGTAFIYTPSSNDTSATFTWTRAAVNGISNAEIVDPQTNDPNEILYDTTANPVSVIYSYSIIANGCSVVVPVTVIVNPAPAVTISGLTTICAGESTTLTAAGGPPYAWSTGDTTASIIIVPSITTTYTVTIANPTGCSGTATQDVTVNPLPSVDFSGLPDTTCIYAEGIALTGIPPGGTFSGNGMVGNVLSPPDAGEGIDTITYYYTDANGCSNSTSQVIYVSLCVGIANISSNYNYLYVYPNPANDAVTVSFNAYESGSYVIQLLDQLGRTIIMENRKAIAGSNTLALSLNGIAKGEYMLMLREGDHVFEAKVVVE